MMKDDSASYERSVGGVVIHASKFSVVVAV